jgi:3-phosphoshikimate 1-carboxyvinyltransferase
MSLAAIAPLADGPTRIRNVANIRIKETDRLAAIAAELERLGQLVTITEDSLSLEPRPLRPAVVKTYADHRMAMSFAVLGMARGHVSVEDPGCVAKTYPGFWEDVAACYRAVDAAVPFPPEPGAG